MERDGESQEVEFSHYAQLQQTACAVSLCGVGLNGAMQCKRESYSMYSHVDFSAGLSGGVLCLAL